MFWTIVTIFGVIYLLVLGGAGIHDLAKKATTPPKDVSDHPKWVENLVAALLIIGILWLASRCT